MDEKRLERVERDLQESTRDLSVLKDWRTRTDSEIEVQRKERHRVNGILQKHLGELESLREDVDDIQSTVDQHSHVLVATNLPDLLKDVRTLQNVNIANQATEKVADRRNERVWQVVSGVAIILLAAFITWYVGMHRQEDAQRDAPTLGVRP